MLCHLHGVLSVDALAEIETLCSDIEFEPGVTSAGFRARRVKNNEQATAGDVMGQIEDRLLNALELHKVFQAAALPLAIKTPLLSRYSASHGYGAHVDDAVMGRVDPLRADIAVTIFLNDPDDYDGGELTLRSPYGKVQIKMPRGDAVMYPANTVHQVSSIERGQRLAAVTWVQSQVRDAEKREALYDLHQVAQAMHSEMVDAPQTTLAFKTYSNLLRLWAEL